LRALPEWSRTQVETKYASLSAKAGRLLTFAELHKAINSLRPNIDRDIKQHGAERAKFIPKKKVKPAANHQTYSLGIAPNTDTVGTKKYPPNKGNTDNSFTPKPTTRYFYKNNQGGQNNSSKAPQKGKSNNRNFNKKQPTGRPVQNCILCGYKNHKADDCRNMRDDNGEIKKVLAPYGKCTACPASVQPRLNHPPTLCPFRPKGPLAGRAN
jgi:hypothetical protein